MYGVNVGILWNAVRDLRPSFAQIRGFENHGMKIVGEMQVGCSIGGVRIKRGRLDQIDARPLGQLLWSDVGPVFSTIL